MLVLFTSFLTETPSTLVYIILLSCFFYIFLLIRATSPRYRIDFLIKKYWCFLLPLLSVLFCWLYVCINL